MSNFKVGDIICYTAKGCFRISRIVADIGFYYKIDDIYNSFLYSTNGPTGVLLTKHSAEKYYKKIDNDYVIRLLYGDFNE